jgi:hypothetical protein
LQRSDQLTGNDSGHVWRNFGRQGTPDGCNETSYPLRCRPTHLERLARHLRGKGSDRATALGRGQVTVR